MERMMMPEGRSFVTGSDFPFCYQYWKYKNFRTYMVSDESGSG
jgi:hypothetical protein